MPPSGSDVVGRIEIDPAQRAGSRPRARRATRRRRPAAAGPAAGRSADSRSRSAPASPSDRRQPICRCAKSWQTPWRSASTRVTGVAIVVDVGIERELVVDRGASGRPPPRAAAGPAGTTRARTSASSGGRRDVGRRIANCATLACGSAAPVDAARRAPLPTARSASGSIGGSAARHLDDAAARPRAAPSYGVSIVNWCDGVAEVVDALRRGGRRRLDRQVVRTARADAAASRGSDTRRAARSTRRPRGRSASRARCDRRGGRHSADRRRAARS